MPELIELPSKETIEYGRARVEEVRDKYLRWVTDSRNTGKEETAKRFLAVVHALEREFLGGEGCVITSFDSRYLDDLFRTEYERVFND